MWLGLRLTDGPARAQHWVAVLAGLALAQGIVGYAQWFAGVPWALVAFHMLMATLVWVSALELLLSLRERGRVSP
jgi:cytochrome c oxidase assembly protein subunit 15